jgi:FkbM family methyltransferase
MSKKYEEALQTLCDRESYWLRQRAEVLKERKIVIFPAGPTAQTFFYTLLNDYGIEAEFFIDNAPSLKDRTICGKPIHARPWETHPHFCDEYTVLIPTVAKYYHQIVEQLDRAGVHAYMHASSFLASQLWSRYKRVLSLLDGTQSRMAYLGASYSMLTLDNSFIQNEGNQYFAINEFAFNEGETVVDAGAYVGDTVEEFVKRGTTGVKIFAFEPYYKAYSKLEARVERLKNEWLIENDDIIAIPAGLGIETKREKFAYMDSRMLKPAGSGDEEVMVYSLDDYFKDKRPFTLLKADVEGGEMDILRGAAGMIKSHKPKMALSIYHSANDFVQIAEYVHELVPEYRFAVRNHHFDYTDTVLYCWI